MTQILRSVAVVLLLAGCGGSSGGDKAKVSATWSLKKADGSADVCPTNYGKVKISAQGYALNEITTGDPFEQVFDCAAGAGSIDLQISGDEEGVCDDTGSCSRSAANDLSGKYEITVWLTEASGQTHYIPSFSKVVDVSKGDQSVSLEIYPNASFRFYQWRFQGKSTGQELGCSAAGVDTLKVTTTRTMTLEGEPVSNPKVTVNTYPCASDSKDAEYFGALSSPLEYGIYTTKVEAFTGSQRVGMSFDETSTETVDRTSVGSVGGHVKVIFPDTYFLEVETR
ncbi:MAG: hypothetical protein EOO71_11615 [Myxococcaceae bacterium]|nr:MAG: hypothetical protein EOO71_11615 [Myxococcaceae bacterium]